jgi:hypothetical protein
MLGMRHLLEPYLCRLLLRVLRRRPDLLLLIEVRM